MRPHVTIPSRRRNGAILLEVVLSLSLFVLAAVLVLTALDASREAVGLVRRDMHGENLAMSVLADLEMGQIDLATLEDSPYEFTDDEEDPLSGWTWQISSEALALSDELPPEQRLTIVIRDPSGRRAIRIYTLWPAQDEEGLDDVDEDSATEAPPAMGGGL